MSLRPPSTSPSPSPGPHENGKVSARQSMGPSSRGTPSLAPASPRPGGQGNVRPTSELLGSAGMFQTPEAEALDQWFENLQNYEQTLEDMAAASLDVNFKEELGAIEQWFKVLSEAERTAALYSLLQHSTQVQIRFFITVLQQMARSDPMTALLSPAMGSMQSQMESRLAGMKSPGFKSNLPASPTARNFSTNNRQSLTLDNSTNYLSPDSAATQGTTGGQNDAAAATLAQQRAKLKASNASHRISAPVLSSPAADGRASWAASTTLSQVSEQASPGQEVPVSTSRPKSTDFSGAIGTPKNTTSTASTATNEAAAPPANEWASMVTTPLIPMFKKQEPRPEPVAAKTANDWHNNPGPGVPRMGDPTIHRKNKNHNNHNNSNDSGAMYDDNGNSIQSGGGGGGGAGRGGMRNASGGGQWKSQALNTNQSNRFGNDGSSDVGSNSMNGLGMQMGGGPGGGAPGFGMGPLGSPTMGMPGLGVGMGNMGMQPMSPFNMNMLGMMSPEAQILAAQMAASGFGQPNWMGMQPMSAGIGPGGMLSAGLGSAGLGGMGGPGGNRKGPQSARSTGGGLRSASSVGSHQAPKGEEDVDPALLNDIPAWLRSLRLHKYTPNFEGAKWQDMVLMDEAALEAKGVAALGARRKMLKTFELVRKKMGIEGGPSTPVPASATPGGNNGNGNGNGTAPNSAAPAGAGGA